MKINKHAKLVLTQEEFDRLHNPKNRHVLTAYKLATVVGEHVHATDASIATVR